MAYALASVRKALESIPGLRLAVAVFGITQRANCRIAGSEQAQATYPPPWASCDPQLFAPAAPQQRLRARPLPRRQLVFSRRLVPKLCLPLRSLYLRKGEEVGENHVDGHVAAAVGFETAQPLYELWGLPTLEKPAPRAMLPTQGRSIPVPSRFANFQN